MLIKGCTFAAVKWVSARDLIYRVSEVKSLSCVRLFMTPWTVAYQAPPSMGFSRQEYWSGLPFPSPRDLPNPWSNPDLLHCRQIFYQLSHKGSSRILEWVAYPFSSGSSWLRNWTRVSCIGGRFFTNWAISKRCLLHGRKAMANLDNILKNRDITLPTKVYIVKAMVFPVVMYGCESLDHKEGWVPNNWCFQTEVLEKTIESPLDCKENKPVNPRGNQSWIFMGRTDAEAQAPIL